MLLFFYRGQGLHRLSLANPGLGFDARQVNGAGRDDAVRRDNSGPYSRLAGDAGAAALERRHRAAAGDGVGQLAAIVDVVLQRAAEADEVDGASLEVEVEGEVLGGA